MIPLELIALCPATRPALLHCENCHVLACRWRRDRYFDWARVLYCSCGNDWIVCGYCKGVRTIFRNKKSLNNHNKLDHSDRLETDGPQKPNGKRTRNSISPHNMSDSLDNCNDGSDGYIWMERRTSPMKLATTSGILFHGNRTESNERILTKVAYDNEIKSACCLSSANFGNINSTTYFNADINGNGVADIVALGQFGISSLGAELTAADVQYTTDIANFVHNLSQNQRRDLSLILAETVAKVNRDRTDRRLWKTNIPTSPEEMRRQYWDGKSSFLCNIPYPTVESIGEHAYVSIRQCIQNRLAFGFGIEKLVIVEDPTAPVRSVMQSPKCQQVIQACTNKYDVPVLILFLKEWQDGYDPHSFSKANRGSVWIKTITISEPHEHKNQSEVRYWIAKH